MYLEHIKEAAWNVSKDLEVKESRLSSLSNVEQECHITILRAGFINEKEQEIRVACSHQGYITELSKSNLFTLRKVLVSIHPQTRGYLLEVVGDLANNGLTIRKKERTFTEEEIQAQRNRFKLMQQRKKEKQNETN